MKSIFRIAGWLCCAIALLCFAHGLMRELGIAILSAAFWSVLGLTLLYFTREGLRPSEIKAPGSAGGPHR